MCIIYVDTVAMCCVRETEAVDYVITQVLLLLFSSREKERRSGHVRNQMVRLRL